MAGCSCSTGGTNVSVASSEAATLSQRPLLTVTIQTPPGGSSVTFQEGANSYAGTLDTFIRDGPEAGSSFGTLGTFEWDFE